MSKWPKIPNQERTEAMLKQGAELGLTIKDACIYAHISYKFYRENIGWARPAYLAGKASRSKRALAPGVLAHEIITRRMQAIAEKVTADPSASLSAEELDTMTKAHRWGMDEHRRLMMSEHRKIEWQELRLKKRALEMRIEEQAAEHMDYIASATPMTSEELAAYTADDYEDSYGD